MKKGRKKNYWSMQMTAVHQMLIFHPFNGRFFSGSIKICLNLIRKANFLNTFFSNETIKFILEWQFYEVVKRMLWGMCQKNISLKPLEEIQGIHIPVELNCCLCHLTCFEYLQRLEKKFASHQDLMMMIKCLNSSKIYINTSNKGDFSLKNEIIIKMLLLFSINHRCIRKIRVPLSIGTLTCTL